ncbi:MAG: hypothetical protein IID33_15320 [Planctomycetes bacterium]|nr:hypothetical protein [Planctomycetota bacterium]
MKRLLARNRKSSSHVAENESENPKQAAAIVSDSISLPNSSAETDAVDPATTTTVEDHAVHAAGETHIANEVSARPDHRTRQDKDEIRAGLDSMRELANLSARTAVAAHTRKQFRSQITVRTGMLVISLVAAAVFFTGGLWSSISYVQYGWASLAVAIIAAMALSRSKMAAHSMTRRGFADSSNEGSQNATPESGDADESPPSEQSGETNPTQTPNDPIENDLGETNHQS